MTPEALVSRAEQELLSKFPSSTLTMKAPCLGPGTHTLPTKASSPSSRPATAPPNSNNWWHPRSHRKPDHHKSRLLPTATPRPSTPDHTPCPKEPHQRRGQDPIPLPAHRGRAEHVHSDWKRLHRGSSPCVPAGGEPLARLRGPAPPARPHGPHPHVPPARPPAASAPPLATLPPASGAGRGPPPLKGLGRGGWGAGGDAGACKGQSVPGAVDPHVPSASRPFPRHREPGTQRAAPRLSPFAEAPLAATRSPQAAGADYPASAGVGEVLSCIRD